MLRRCQPTDRHYALLTGQHRGQAGRTLGPNEVAKIPEIDRQDFAVRKYHCVERLILRAGRHPTIRRQMTQKRFNVRLAAVAWMAPTPGWSSICRVQLPGDRTADNALSIPGRFVR